MNYTEKYITQKLDKKIKRIKQELSAVKKEKEERLIEYRKSILTVGKKVRLTRNGCGDDYSCIEGVIESVHKDYFSLIITDCGIDYPLYMFYGDFTYSFDSIEIIDDK